MAAPVELGVMLPLGWRGELTPVGDELRSRCLLGGWPIDLYSRDGGQHLHTGDASAIGRHLQRHR